MLGCCASNALCDLHRDGLYQQLAGVAALRGQLWADKVAGQRADLIGQPWPQSERMRSIARRKVADLSSDEALLELLEAELVRWAVKRWTAR